MKPRPLILSYVDYEPIERGLYPISRSDIIEAIKKDIVITVKKEGITYTIKLDDNNNLSLVKKENPLCHD
jgi:hypothetical protein